MNPETIPWYKSDIQRQQIVAFILAVGALTKWKFDFDVSATVNAIFLGIAAVIPVWTFVTRMLKATPPLTQKAIRDEIKKVQEGKIPPSPTGPATPATQGGFVRPLMLVLLLALCTPLVLVLSGCAGTTLAYKQAQSPDEFAFVISEHYASLVNEAATLKERGVASPEQVAAMQAADRAAKPQVLKLRELRDSYLAVKNATTEQELQRAIDDAVLLVADLVRSVKAARGTGTSSLIEQRILLEANVLERSPA